MRESVDIIWREIPAYPKITYLKPISGRAQKVFTRRFLVSYNGWYGFDGPRSFILDWTHQKWPKPDFIVIPEEEYVGLR